MAEFKKGDVVQLKSGGPIMTIDWVKGNECQCESIARVGNPLYTHCALAMLKLVGEPESPKPE